MKTRIETSSLVIASFLLLSFPASSLRAADGTIGPYLHFDAGPAVTEDTDLKRFAGPSPGVEVEFDPGLHFGAAGGFQVTPWFAAELETGFTANYIDRLRGTSGIALHNSSFSNVPLLANVVFRYPTPIGLIPFIGAGAGMSFSTLDADEITDHSTFVVDGTDTDAVFAYQAFAGLRYRLNEQMDLGLQYKYFYSDSASWDVDVYFYSNDRIKFDSIHSHLVAFTFTLRF
jgi:opacity protein-like surface antigen